jgi:hypothetical protein
MFSVPKSLRDRARQVRSAADGSTREAGPVGTLARRARPVLGVALVVVGVAVIVFSYTSPSLNNTLVGAIQGRSTELQSIDFAVNVASDGSAKVVERVEFYGDDGGRIEVPSKTDLTVDGETVTSAASSNGFKIRVPHRQASVAYADKNLVIRSPDLAVLRLPILSPGDGERGDPDYDVSGVVRLPGEPATRSVHANVFIGRDRDASVENGIVHFEAKAASWAMNYDDSLSVSFPSSSISDAAFGGLVGTDTPQSYATHVAQREETSRINEEVYADESKSQSGGSVFGDLGSIWPVLLFPGVSGLFFVVRLIGQIRQRLSTHRQSAIDVPGELPEPPGSEDPALVSVLWNRGTPSRDAVAGTVLALASSHALSISETDPEHFALAITKSATANGPHETLVLDELRREHADGKTTGPPLWDSTSWWPSYARLARGQAQLEELAQPVVSAAQLSVSSVLTLAVLGSFVLPLIGVVGLALIAFGVSLLASALAGDVLTETGVARRAQWGAFANYLNKQGSVHDLGPAAIAIWGPNLVYGAVIGAAPRAARELRPSGDSDDADDPSVEVVLSH